MKCEFCSKEFSIKSSLVYHQKTAKYCLEKQGKTNEQYKCSHCEKCFSTQYRLNDHQNNSCKIKDKTKYELDILSVKEEFLTYKKQEKVKLREKDVYYQQQIKEKDVYYQQQIKEKEIYYQQQIKEKEIYLLSFDEKLKERYEYITKLEAKLEKFEDSILSKTEKKIQPITNNTTNNTTNNNIVINALNLNDIEKMTSFLEEKLDKNVLAGGQKGLAKLLSETMLKDRYKCVDPSRQNFEFTNELGELERDVKAKKLTNALIKGDICSKSADKGIKLWTKDDGSTDSLSRQAHSANVFDMINFDRDNSTFRSELTALTS